MEAIRHRMAVLVAALALGLTGGAAGCGDDDNQGPAEEAEEAAQEAEQGAEEAGQAAEEAGQEVEEADKEVGGKE